MKVIPLLLIIAGIVLVQSARTDKDPRNIIFESLGLPQRVRNFNPIDAKPTWVDPTNQGTAATTPGQKEVFV